MHKKIIIFILMLMPLSYAISYPKLTDFITDNANIISPEYEQRVTELIKKIEQETTAEIAVVTVNSLEGITKEQYALELAERTKLGKKNKDNGLLILIALEEREYRVEVGYGLESLIPDASKVTIGTRILEPNFKQGEFGKGIYEALLVIEGLLKGQEEVISKYQSQSISITTWIFIILFLLIFFSTIFNFIWIISGKRKFKRSIFFPLVMPGPKWNNGTGNFGSRGFGGFGGSSGFGGGGGFGGSW